MIECDGKGCGLWFHYGGYRCAKLSEEEIRNIADVVYLCARCKEINNVVDTEKVEKDKIDNSRKVEGPKLSPLPVSKIRYENSEKRIAMNLSFQELSSNLFDNEDFISSTQITHDENCQSSNKIEREFSKKDIVKGIVNCFSEESINTVLNETLFEKSGLGKINNSIEQSSQNISRIFSNEQFSKFLNETIFEENGVLRIKSCNQTEFNIQSNNQSKQIKKGISNMLCGEEISNFLCKNILNENNELKVNTSDSKTSNLTLHNEANVSKNEFVTGINGFVGNVDFVNFINDTIFEQEGEIKCLSRGVNAMFGDSMNATLGLDLSVADFSTVGSVASAF